MQGIYKQEKFMRIDVVVRKVQDSFFLFNEDKVKIVIDREFPVTINNKIFIPIFTYDRWGLKVLLFKTTERERREHLFSNLIKLIKKDGRRPLAFFRDGMKGSVALSSSEMRRKFFVPKA